MDGNISYIYNPDRSPLEQISGSTVYYYQQDQLGSTRLLTSSTGSVADSYSYASYSATLASTGTVVNPLQYAGQYLDAETGLHYMRARYYDPATGQFISQDPLVALTGSPYGYVGGNPTNGIDPFGLCSGPTCWVPDIINQAEGVVHQIGNDIHKVVDTTGHALAITASAVSSATQWMANCVIQLCLSHPIEAITAIIALVTISAVVIAGGWAACATLIGCIAGAPLLAIGIAGMGAAIALTFEEFKHAGVFAPRPEHLGAMSSNGIFKGCVN